MSADAVAASELVQTGACPKRVVLDRVGDRWTALVVGLLAEGPLRHGRLASQIGEVAEISQKMLTQTLRHLERDGLVERTVHASVPPRVDYELTDLGRSLAAPLAALGEWAEAHAAQIHQARAGYDERVRRG